MSKKFSKIKTLKCDHGNTFLYEKYDLGHYFYAKKFSIIMAYDINIKKNKKMKG